MKRAAVALIPLLLTGCGSTDETSSAAPRPSKQPAPARTSAAPPSPAVQCLPVDQPVLDEIAGPAGVAGALTLSNGRAYMSPDYAQVYFVAATVAVPGAEQIGVWATNDIVPGALGTILAVDDTAQTFTDWPDADESEARISKSDSAVTAAIGCVNKGT